jgi:hypothetical protein
VPICEEKHGRRDEQIELPSSREIVKGEEELV